MSDHSDTLDRIRDGEVIRFKTERRVYYVDAEMAEHDPEIVDSFYLRIYDSEEQEMARARSIDGLKLCKTLSHHDYCILSKTVAEKQMDSFRNIEGDLDADLAERLGELVEQQMAAQRD